MSGTPFVNPNIFDRAHSGEYLAQARPSLNIHIRLVDNGALIFMSGSHPSIPATAASPERVATTPEQAVEAIREMLTKVWPVAPR